MSRVPTPADVFGPRGALRKSSWELGDPQPRVTPPNPASRGADNGARFEPESGRPLPGRRRPAKGYGGESQGIMVGMAILNYDDGDAVGFGEGIVHPRAVLRGPQTPRRRYDVDEDPRQPGYGDEPRRCATIDPEVFFTPAGMTGPWFKGPRRRELAKLCARCPVMQKCQDWAVENRETGWWGGTDDTDREQIRADRRIRNELSG